MASIYKMADMMNTLEFVPLGIGLVYLIIAAVGLLVSVTFIVLMLMA